MRSVAKAGKQSGGTCEFDQVTAQTGCAIRSRNNRTSKPSNAHVIYTQRGLVRDEQHVAAFVPPSNFFYHFIARAATVNAVSPPGVPRLATLSAQFFATISPGRRSFLCEPRRALTELIDLLRRLPSHRL